VPILTGQFTQTGGSAVSNPFQTFERRDVGISLKVRPQISESGAVRLFISQEVSSVAPESSSAGLVFNKRSIDSTVLVDDGKIVVLGGLLKDDVTKSDDKVPVLGDLPAVGALFKYAKKSRVKTNLMVFLRPQVLRDEAAASAVTQSRAAGIRQSQQATPGAEGPLLPPMPQ
jgi:general secretion pathway protein D